MAKTGKVCAGTVGDDDVPSVKQRLRLAAGMFDEVRLGHRCGKWCEPEDGAYMIHGGMRKDGHDQDDHQRPGSREQHRTGGGRLGGRGRDAAEPESDYRAQERSTGVAIALLAVLVLLLLVAIVTGATDAYQP